MKRTRSRCSRYYDRAGRPLGALEWAALFEGGEAQRVAETTLPNGRWVSTVWLGLDHSFGMGGPPLIFETMVFARRGDGGSDLDQVRYATEAEALAGHDRLCQKWAQDEPPE